MSSKPQFVGEERSLEKRVEYVRGVTYKAAADLHEELDDSSYVLLRANNIQGGELKFDDVQYVDRSKVKPKQLLRRGDILVCASSGSKGLVGKAALVRESIPVTFGAFCYVLRPKHNEAEYLGHYFQSRQYRRAIEEACSGSNINNLKASNFLSLVVPHYDNDSIRAISALFDSIDVQIKKAKDQISSLDDLVKSRFVEMFGDPMEHCDRWPMLRLDDFTQVITGNTPSRKHPEYYGEGIEWVKTDRIFNSVVETSAEQLTEEGRSKARTAPAGSILMACIAGSIKSIGKVGLLDREVAFNQQINAIVPSDRVDPHFLLVMLSLSKDYLCSDVNKQLKGILNKSTLSAKRFPLPPLDNQRQFAAFVQQVTKSQTIAQQQIEKLQTLYDSLAQEYFS